MPDLSPFRGLRYSRATDLDAVTAPPYDVIDEDDRARLEGSDPHNAVRLILPRHDGDDDGYVAAAATLTAWRAAGVLELDDTAHLYAYRMTYELPAMGRRETCGVIGALGIPGVDEPGEVLPHERTLPKARSDRLSLLRATRANLDPIWGLSLAEGLTTAIGDFVPVEQAHDTAGVLHELMPLDAARSAAVRTMVDGAPVVIADGHHRFETARTYSSEKPDDAAARAIMALVVELCDEQLCVRPIHRLVHGGGDVRGRLARAFTLEDAGAIHPEAVEALTERMAQSRAFGFVDREGLALVHVDESDERLAALPQTQRDVDAARFDVLVRPLLDDAELSYRDDAVTVAALVEKGAAESAVLLRPVSVAQIRAVAFAGERMPEKTTFFQPKPRTGMVFRSLDD